MFTFEAYVPTGQVPNVMYYDVLLHYYIYLLVNNKVLYHNLN